MSGNVQGAIGEKAGRANGCTMLGVRMGITKKKLNANDDKTEKNENLLEKHEEKKVLEKVQFKMRNKR